MISAVAERLTARMFLMREFQLTPDVLTNINPTLRTITMIMVVKGFAITNDAAKTPITELLARPREAVDENTKSMRIIEPQMMKCSG